MPLVTLKQRQKEYSTIFDIWLIIYRVPCFRLQYGTTFDRGLLTAIRIVVVTDRMINCWYMHKILRKRWWFNLTTKIYLITEFWKPKYISLNLSMKMDCYICIFIITASIIIITKCYVAIRALVLTIPLTQPCFV